MANKMNIEKRNAIRRLLVEGNSVRSVCRLMGTHVPSVLRQLLWASVHCRKLKDSSNGITPRLSVSFPPVANMELQ